MLPQEEINIMNFRVVLHVVYKKTSMFSSWLLCTGIFLWSTVKPKKALKPWITITNKRFLTTWESTLVHLSCFPFLTNRTWHQRCRRARCCSTLLPWPSSTLSPPKRFWPLKMDCPRATSGRDPPCGGTQLGLRRTPPSLSSLPSLDGRLDTRGSHDERMLTN